MVREAASRPTPSRARASAASTTTDARMGGGGGFAAGGWRWWLPGRDDGRGLCSRRGRLPRAASVGGFGGGASGAIASTVGFLRGGACAPIGRRLPRRGFRRNIGRQLPRRGSSERAASGLSGQELRSDLFSLG